MTTDITIAGYLKEMLTGEESSEALGELICKCDSDKLRVLWQIFFDTGIHDLSLLEERIYTFGSTLEERDMLGREVFLALASLVRQAKNKENNLRM